MNPQGSSAAAACRDACERSCAGLIPPMEQVNGPRARGNDKCPLRHAVSARQKPPKSLQSRERRRGRQEMQSKRMKHHGLIAAALAVAISLSGCSGSVAQKPKAAPPAPPLKIAGVAFRGQSRGVITAALDKLGLYAARTNPEYWCDFWTQGKATKFPGLGHLRVCYTEHGRWAETKLVYGGGADLAAVQGAKRPRGGWSLLIVHGMSHAPTFSGLTQAISREYGKPVDDIDPPIGEKIASWITSAGNIIVDNSFPSQHVTLSLTDPLAYRAWKAQMKAQQARQQQAANPLGN